MPNQTYSPLSTKTANAININQNQASPSKATNNKLDAYEFLSSLHEFRDLPVEDLKTLANSAKFVTYGSGEYIKIEGEQERSYGYIIVSGLVAMTKTSINGKELIVELLQENDIFGLLLMLAADKLPLQLSAKSLHKSNLLLVPINNFTNMLKTQPNMFKDFVAHLLISLQSSYGLSRGLAHDLVEVRIASVLSSLALKLNKSASIDTCTKSTSIESYCSIKLTRQQLANLTGTTPETAIRVTRAMQRDKLIEISQPGTINITNLKELLELAEN